MAETGSSILNYRGDAGLGLGSNASIPAINPNANLDVINQTARDLLLLNHENNINLYHQKVKDRDTTLDLIAKGQIASGNIDPNDRKYYDEAKQSAMDSFHDAMSKGGLLSNPDAYKDYLGKVANLKNVTDWAQHRELGLAELQAERSKQTLPEDISAYDNHIKEQKDQPFWNPVKPFQKAFDYNLNSSTSNVLGESVTEGEIGKMPSNAQQTGTTQWNSVTDKNGVITQKQTTKTAPLKSGQIVQPKGTKGGISVTGTQVNPDGTISEISYTPEKFWDFHTIQKNVDEQSSSNPTERYTYHKWLDDFQNKLPADQQLSTLQAYNNRIADYSTQRGIQPDGNNPDGTPHYPDQIKYYPDPISKKVLIQETPESFFAKHSLASIKGDYVEKPQAVFNKDIAAYKINKEKANTDAIYKMGMLNNARNKTKGYLDNLHQQMKFRKDASEQDNLLDEIYTRNLIQQPLIKGEGGNLFSLAKIQANNSLPIFTLDGKTPKQLIPIGGKAIYSEDSYVDPADHSKGLNPKAKVLYYEGGHYDPTYLLNGKPLSQQQVNNNYLNFKKIAGKNWTGGLEEYLKEAIKDPKNTGFSVKITGANGSTDSELSKAAQRIISNQATKKGQTSVFDGSENNPPLDETIQESSSTDTNQNSQ